MSTPALRNPFVIQCKSCNHVVGDSFSLLDYKNNSLILSSVASIVTIDPTKHTDSDTVYSFLRCKCSSFVGRRYYTTGADMNGYSGMYFMTKENIYTYALGGNSAGKCVTLFDVVEDVEKLQKLCLYLYKKLNK